MRTLRTMLALAVLSLVALGCERAQPEPPDGGRRRDAGVDAGPRDDGGPPRDSGPPPDGSVLDSGTPDGGCVSRPECWSCPPTTNAHFLNACTTATCQPFPNNRARLPRLNADGTVPPLP
jgi:hypothetical protein